MSKIVYTECVDEQEYFYFGLLPNSTVVTKSPDQVRSYRCWLARRGYQLIPKFALPQ